MYDLTLTGPLEHRLAKMEETTIYPDVSPENSTKCLVRTKLEVASDGVDVYRNIKLLQLALDSCKYLGVHGSLLSRKIHDFCKIRQMIILDVLLIEFREDFEPFT